MKTSVCKTFRFDAAHYLPNYEGVCSRLHGHSWVLEVEVYGDVSSDSGMVVDFAELKREVNDLVIGVLDHTLLNNTIENPTCEFLLEWIWDRLRYNSGLFVGGKKLQMLNRLRLYETPDSFAELTL